MKKLLTIFLILSSLISKAQSPIQSIGVSGGQVWAKGQMRIDSVLFLPQYSDTNFIPTRAGAEIFRTADKQTYIYNGKQWALLSGIVWGTVPGNIINQTDLYDSLLLRQFKLVNGYGTIANTYSVTLDTANIRIIDSAYRIIGKDSIYFHRINGTTFQILDSLGSPGSGTITGGAGFSPLFTNGVSGGNTITYTAVNQGANLIYAGPSTGSAAAPTFRSLSVSDLPTGIPTANLANSNILFSIGSSGSSPNWSSGSVNLGGTAILNLPTASASVSGTLSSADWTTFNGKVTSVNGRTGVVVTKIADTLKSLPIDTTSNRQGYVLSFDSTNHKWYLAPGGGGGGTTYSIGAIDGNGAASNGLSISGSSIFAQSASVTVPGQVNNTTQSFSGNKTFTGSLTLTGITQKSPGATDSALLRDASGKLWVFPISQKVNISDTAAMLAGYLQAATSLSPLFTTANSAHVATFTLSNAAAHKFFGNFTGSSAAPSYSSPALASADFLNQGTTVTVLHGNAAGNPSWGSVALATDVSGILPIANGGTGTATPGLVQGVGIKITNAWPNSTVAVDTASFKDTVFARNIGTTLGADSLMYVINSTTIGIRKILFRSNLTVSYNADSVLVLDAANGAGSGVTTVGAINSQSPSTNGLVISGFNIYAQYATATAPGMLSTASQTIAGLKTFSSAPKFSTLTNLGGVFVGDAAGNVSETGSGSTNQTLHGGATPSFSLVALATDITGILPVANGGNGTATPSISGSASITVTGSWPTYTISAVNLGTVTSVNISGGATGLSFTGGPITSSGTINTSGTLVPASGGTGLSSYTPNAPLVGGSTATGTLQQVSNGTEGQVLTYHAGAIPTWTTVTGGGGSSILTRTSVTSGTSSTVLGGNYLITFNPSAVIASYTLTLPSSPSDEDVVEIEAGGTITGGAPVVTSLTISPNSGQTIHQSSTPTSISDGEFIKYRYRTANTSWYRRD